LNIIFFSDEQLKKVEGLISDDGFIKYISLYEPMYLYSSIHEHVAGCVLGMGRNEYGNINKLIGIFVDNRSVLSYEALRERYSISCDDSLIFDKLNIFKISSVND
jgi:hypothetical protein